MTHQRKICALDNMGALSGLDDGSVTLAYLDPPFNSGRSYEALLGRGSTRSSTAFTDAWTWGDEAESDLGRLHEWVPAYAAGLIQSVVGTLGRSDLSAYLVMMTPRLGEVRRVLADNGSLYLHCDPAASHYLKIILDQIFGPDNFRNEIIWKRTHAHSGSRRFGPVHDVILYYSKSKHYLWNQGHTAYSDDYIEKYFRNRDAKGSYQLITCTGPGPRPNTRAHFKWRGVWPPANRHWAWTEDVMEQLEATNRLVYSSNGVPRLKRYVDDGAGVRLQDLWLDINPLGAHSTERTGYETQKPIGLLRRIIQASSSPGDLVIDPFCGTGTTAVAAESLGRQWLVVDSSLLAASLTLARVRNTGTEAPIALQGFPSSLSAVLSIQRNDPTTFAVWGTGMLGTLLEKESMSDELARGTRRLGIGQASRSIVSWVPLRPDGGGARNAALYRSTADYGIVLVTNPSTRTLGRWLIDRLELPIQSVEVESLLGADAARLGIAPALVAAA